ncbi:helix-turn-helix domain-containing protein [Tamlana sp. 2201CG12-4]|uniref:helix-turn-helix domain-containing protein n=1 Tax=Tamlana sp. 2201CG12-4 TaxID=3112582 RepID=UPI002DBB129C|nr:helix-turn-helix domain-containing protein [Tamlana sp. 2201CG12-4]MEC3906193.1 helix-turn-helix domain-containing protein [Tamlana sp. 2201CG12-4]
MEEFYEHIVSYIDIVGLVHGISLGTLLILLSKKNKKSTFFLGVFIIAYGLELIPSILDDLKITEKHPQLLFLPLSFGWILFPIFYLYIKNISILPDQKRHHWVFIPGTLYLLAECIAFCQPIETKQMLIESVWLDIIDIIEIIYFLFIGVFILNEIKKHRREVQNQYSSTEYKELSWARFFILFSLFFICLDFILFVFLDSSFPYVIISAINVILLFWISLKGIFQNKVNLLTHETLNKDIALKAKQISDKEHYSDKIKLIENYLYTSKAYTNPDLTIIDIANATGLHPRQVSRTINITKGYNFANLINRLRVEEAKSILLTDRAEQLSMEGIGKDVGFNSKSSFYMAFKKHTKTTPHVFKNN